MRAGRDYIRTRPICNRAARGAGDSRTPCRARRATVSGGNTYIAIPPSTLITCPVTYEAALAKVMADAPLALAA